MPDESHSRVSQRIEILHDLFHPFPVIYPDVGNVFSGCSDIVKHDGNLGIGEDLH